MANPIDPRTETLWQSVSESALLGTQRKPYIEISAEPGDPVTSLVQQEEKANLLRDAALLSLYRRAGRLPALASESVPAERNVSPFVDLPRCSPRAGQLLVQILSIKGYESLLGEWLETAVRAGQRVREEHLPLLLAQQKLIEPLRPLLLPALGERGRWLAAQNPEWAPYVRFAGDEVWHEGAKKERLAYLRDLRAVEPERACSLLASTWAQEPLANRAAFLDVLDANLSMSDEPFLEGVLDDRRKEIRKSAALLLARLPESRLVQRMTARARKLLAWKNGLLRSSLEVHPPAGLDEAMLRDGLEYKPPTGTQMGEKAWWLAQIIGMVPPSAWSAGWNKRPNAIIELARKHEWEDALLMGWTQAALRSADEEWLEALMRYTMRGEDLSRTMALFTDLPPALKEKLLIPLLRENPPLSYDAPASFYVTACKHPWGAELTEAVTDCICWTLQKGEQQPWRWEKLMRDVIPYPQLDQLEETIRRMELALSRRSAPDPYAAGLASMLKFRLEIAKSFHHSQTNGAGM